MVGETQRLLPRIRETQSGQCLCSVIAIDGMPSILDVCPCCTPTKVPDRFGSCVSRVEFKRCCVSQYAISETQRKLSRIRETQTTRYPRRFLATDGMLSVLVKRSGSTPTKVPDRFDSCVSRVECERRCVSQYAISATQRKLSRIRETQTTRYPRRFLATDGMLSVLVKRSGSTPTKVPDRFDSCVSRVECERRCVSQMANSETQLDLSRIRETQTTRHLRRPSVTDGNPAVPDAALGIASALPTSRCRAVP